MKAFLKYHIKDRLSLGHQSFQLAISAGKTPILVFTMAKVGSLSVYSSIRSISKTPVFHIHSLDEKEILKNIEFCLENGVYPGSRSPVFLINQKIIKRQIPYKIISLFRNPIERNISAFFDAFELYTGVLPHKYKGNLSSLEKIYHQKLPHLYPIQWYEQQFFSATEIDVYKSPFNKIKGYSITRHNKVELLLINTEVENSLKEKLIKDFCKIDNFKLIDINITTHGKASNLYTDFKEYIRFNETYLSGLLNSKYFDHFFTGEDKEASFRKWMK